MILRALVLVVAVGSVSCAGEPAQPETCDAACRARAEAKGSPIVVHRVHPPYPREAARAGVDGCVVASFEILADGRPENFQVLDSQPQGVFELATLVALKDWRFEVPVKPGRYATRMDYWVPPAGSNEAPPLPCIETPGYDALNKVRS